MDQYDGMTCEVRLLIDDPNGKLFTVKEKGIRGVEWTFNVKWATVVDTKCECSVRDLWSLGHRCGRKAPIDKR